MAPFFTRSPQQDLSCPTYRSTSKTLSWWRLNLSFGLLFLVRQSDADQTSVNRPRSSNRDAFEENFGPVISRPHTSSANSRSEAETDLHGASSTVPPPPHRSPRPRAKLRGAASRSGFPVPGVFVIQFAAHFISGSEHRPFLPVSNLGVRGSSTLAGMEDEGPRSADTVYKV